MGETRSMFALGTCEATPEPPNPRAEAAAERAREIALREALSDRHESVAVPFHFSHATERG